MSQPENIIRVKTESHRIRDLLNIWNLDKTPKSTKMLDIWSICLGYRGYNELHRDFTGHANLSKTLPDYSDVLTCDILAAKLHEQLKPNYDYANCKFAVAFLGLNKEVNKNNKQNIISIEKLKLSELT